MHEDYHHHQRIILDLPLWICNSKVYISIFPPCHATCYLLQLWAAGRTACAVPSYLPLVTDSRSPAFT